MRRPRFLLAAAAVASALLVGACSTGPTTGSSNPPESTGTTSTGTDAGAFPVSISTSLGTATIDKAPTRIATAGWSDQDFLLSLGVVPVGAPEITWGGNAKKSTDWFDAALTRLGGSEPTRYSDADGTPVDAIAKLAPDLILATNSGMTQVEYDKLSKIAPVVAYPGAAWGTSWEDSLDLIGKAVGRSGEAAKIKAATQGAITSATAAYPQIKGKTAAWGWFTPTDLSKLGLYSAIDNRPRMLDTFGFKTAPIVTRLSATSPSAFSVDVSAEKAASVDADVLVFYVDAQSQVGKLVANPLLGQLPALKRGSFVASSDNAAALPMSSPTTLSIPVAITSFLPLLAAAADKA